MEHVIARYVVESYFGDTNTQELQRGRGTDIYSNVYKVGGFMSFSVATTSTSKLTPAVLYEIPCSYGELFVVAFTTNYNNLIVESGFIQTVINRFIDL
jgi:hypothetical protein